MNASSSDIYYANNKRMCTVGQFVSKKKRRRSVNITDNF